MLKQALLQASGPILLESFLPVDLPSRSQASKPGEPAHHFRSEMTLADIEREAIQHCLLQTGGNRQRTAEILDISTRTLLRKIRQYELEDPRRHAASDAESNGDGPASR